MHRVCEASTTGRINGADGSYGIGQRTYCVLLQVFACPTAKSPDFWQSTVAKHMYTRVVNCVYVHVALCLAEPCVPG